MLTYQSKESSEKNNKEVIKYRRYLIILLVLVISMSTILTTKLYSDTLKQKRGEDIISSAQKEASEILKDASSMYTDATLALENAEETAVKITTLAKEQANETAEEILSKANESAEEILNKAQREADSIVSEARKKTEKKTSASVSTNQGDMQILLAVTEAEASNQPLEGKAAVASTVLNRVKSSKFKENTIRDVVYAPGQFNVVRSGRINRVRPSESTRKAVELCLQGKDYSKGALYFYNPKYSSRSNKEWFKTLETTTVIGDHVFKK